MTTAATFVTTAAVWTAVVAAAVLSLRWLFAAFRPVGFRRGGSFSFGRPAPGPWPPYTHGCRGHRRHSAYLVRVFLLLLFFFLVPTVIVVTDVVSIRTAVAIVVYTSSADLQS